MGVRGEAVATSYGGNRGKLKFSANMAPVSSDVKPVKQVTVTDVVDVKSECGAQPSPQLQQQQQPSPQQPLPQPQQQQQQQLSSQQQQLPQQQQPLEGMSVVQAQMHTPVTNTSMMSPCRCVCSAQPSPLQPQQPQQPQNMQQPQQLLKTQQPQQLQQLQPQMQPQAYGLQPQQPLLASRHAANNNPNLYNKGNFFNVLSMGGFGRSDIGIAGRRGFPGRRYDQHFTLG